MINKQLIHGLFHPEIGRILVTKHPHDTFESICPFHNSCLEGLPLALLLKRDVFAKGG